MDLGGSREAGSGLVPSLYSIMFLGLLDRFIVLGRWSQLGPVSSLDPYSWPAAMPGVLLELVPRWP